MENKKQTRAYLRQKRRSLTKIQQQQAAKKVARVIATSTEFQRAQNIAFYFANDGEISLEKLFLLALKHQKACYFPVITKNFAMEFRRFHSTRSLVRNRFGIPEPNRLAMKLSAQHLELVLMPLVGFDKKGNRLGMGGGYYDRSFAFKRRTLTTQPVLMGVAHKIQECEELQTDTWDIPLDYIATDKQLLRLNRT